ncbi:MAG: SPOR domain-containing protein, partial [Myxococcota bacterium]
GWAIQVAQHADEGDAARNVETLRAAGLEAYRVVALVGGETVWRVRVGGYSSKEVATAAAPGVGSKAGASSTTVTPAP